MNFKSMLILLLFILIQSSIESDEDNKYFFQIYPSLDQDKPYLFHAQTNSQLLTINSTEGQNCNIISQSANDESTFKNISSVLIINDSYLIKICFMTNKLVEIIHDENTYTYNKDLTNIKSCYSTKILNPSTSNENIEYIFITYFTEMQQDNKYSHKTVLFYPKTKSFSEEIILSIESSSVLKEYYPENCVTLRDTDIYCMTHYKGNDLLSYVIETNKIFLKESNMFLVMGNSFTSSDNRYNKMISFNKQESTYLVTKFKYINKDIFLTESFNEKETFKTWLRYSYYIKETRVSHIKTDNNCGIKISDKYINPHLLNYLAPNDDEILIIYLSQDTKTNLFISRIMTESINSNFKGYAINNYYRTDICSEPMYMQSTYINSFINYEEKDKQYMKENQSNNYYKYERDIGIVISCKGTDISYQPIKVETPQCLNKLDEINGLDIHTLKFNKDTNEIILDIYNDPNLISFRNTSIYFNSSKLFDVLILMQIKEGGSSSYSSLDYNKEYKNITHIKFIKSTELSAKSTFKLPYFLQNKGKSNNNIVNAMKSDLCYLEFKLDDTESPQECLIDYCSVCESQKICKVCDPEIEGIVLDTDAESETFGKCICNETKGFDKSPDLYQMCICKEGYSFYNGKSYCEKTKELDEQPTYKDDIEEKSNITIYKDCPQGCKNCEKNEQDDLICEECLDNFYMKNNECFSQEDINTGEWFKLNEDIFTFLELDECIFIFDKNDLFLISNKEACAPLMINNNYQYITKCLNNDKINMSKFTDIDNVIIYDSSKEGIIAEKYSEDGNIYFHLIKYKSQKINNYKNISTLELISDNNETIIDDYLLFKFDIKRNDTISTQVEYQLYNSNKISEKINLNDLNKDNNNDLSVLLSLPISWKKGQLEKINELSKYNINAFDSSSPFYLDVCNKFTTAKNEDMFLEDRKKEYYPNESFCESDCAFIGFDKDTEKVNCKCNFKENNDNYKNVTFSYNKVNDKFNKKVKYPNLVTMKCSSVVSKSLGNNFGFYLTFILLIIFFGLFLLRVFKEEKKLNKMLEQFKEDIKIKDIKDDQIDNNNNNSKNNNKKKESIIKSNNSIITQKEGSENNQSYDVINNNYNNNNTNSNNNNKSINNNNPNNNNNSNNNNNKVINYREKIENNKYIPPSISEKPQSISTENRNDGYRKFIRKDTSSNDENDNNNITGINQNGSLRNSEQKDDKNKEKKGENNIINNNDDISEKEPSSEIIYITKKEKEKNKKYKEKESVIEQSEENNKDDKQSEIYPIDYSRDSNIKNDDLKSENNTQPNYINNYNINNSYNIYGGNITIFNDAQNIQINSSFNAKAESINQKIEIFNKSKKLYNQEKQDKPNPPPKNRKDVAESYEYFTNKEIKKDYKEYIINNDYILDKKEFKELKKDNKDKRSLCQMYCSLIKNNSTIYYIFTEQFESIFIKWSILIILISLHLCLNTFFLFEMPQVKLYLGSFTIGNFFQNIFILCLVINILIIVIKKYVTSRAFIYELNIEKEKIYIHNNDIQSSNDFLNDKNRIKHEIDNYRIIMNKRAIIYGIIGIIFLIFNCILVTSFCGIYSNSVGGLILNSFMSILISSILLRLAYFFLGAYLRYSSIRKNSEFWYNISRLINILNLSYKEYLNMSFCGKVFDSSNYGQKITDKRSNIHDEPPLDSNKYMYNSDNRF